MTRSVIKTTFMAAVLGCVMLVTSPAYAGTKQVIMVCEEDSSGDKLLITKIFADLPPEDLPSDLSVGQDALQALVILENGGAEIFEETLSQESAPEAGGRTGDAPGAGQGSNYAIFHLRCQKLQGDCFE